MYIRQISRVRKDGSRVRYLQLAHKVRDAGTGIPRDEVLYHFGREDELDKEQLKRLAVSLSRFLASEDRAEVQGRLFGLERELVVERSVAFGGSFELDAALAALLSQRSFSRDLERLVFALVANRALAPRSNTYHCRTRALSNRGNKTLRCYAERRVDARGAGAPRSSPLTLKSSSISGQWMPKPPPASFQFDRCWGVACSNRGYQTSGTAIVLPSRRSTTFRSSAASKPKFHANPTG